MMEPEGYIEIQDIERVFQDGKDIIITGMPPEDSDHNCDVMGCSSVEHVLFRCSAYSGLNLEVQE